MTLKLIASMAAEPQIQKNHIQGAQTVKLQADFQLSMCWGQGWP